LKPGSYTELFFVDEATALRRFDRTATKKTYRAEVHLHPSARSTR
jgi:hypothetical protein